LASLLKEQGHVVIVSVIAPYAETRITIADQIQPIWLHLQGASQAAIEGEWPYELPLPHEPVWTLHEGTLEQVSLEAWQRISIELAL
jgi:hypothetical protein